MPAMLLCESTRDPVIVNFGVTFSHTTNFTFFVYAPSGIDRQ